MMKITFSKTLAFGIAASALLIGAVQISSCNGEGGKEQAPVAAMELPPPVILIIVDTLRADHLSQYGFELDTSPALQEFVSQSTRFSHAYSYAPWTRPSMTTLFTGMHPVRHSVTRRTSLSEEAVTMAEALGSAGMETVGISLNPNVSRKTGLDQGFKVFEEMLGRKTMAYEDVKEMLRLARMWYYGGPKDSYFLFMLPMNVHGPYKVPKKRRKDLLGRRPIKGFKYYGKVMKEILKLRMVTEGRAKVTPEMIQSLHEKYATAVRYTTDKVGKFFEFLKHEGYYDEAIIIVAGDHGEELFDHGGFSHGFTLYDELLHVPLIIKLPYQRAGRVVDERVTLADVFPTVMDLTGQPIPDEVDGKSLAPLLKGEKERLSDEEETEVFSVAWPKRCVGQAAINWPWKLIKLESNYESEEGRTFLFNLELDPGEIKDMSRERPEIVEELSKSLEKKIGTYDSGGKYCNNAKLDKQMEKQLRALGYMQ